MKVIPNPADERSQHRPAPASNVDTRARAADALAQPASAGELIVADYLPGTDADFNTWQENFLAYATANMVALGLTAADLISITSDQGTWDSAYAAHTAARNAALGAKQMKDEAKADYIADIRPLVRRLQASTSVTDAEKGALGITIAQPREPIGAPTTAPLVSVECGQRLQHTLRFVDAATPSRKGKPAGVLGVEIWNKVGTTPPVSQSDLQFIAMDTSAPYVLDFNGADGGKSVYYWLRWVSPTGERGPWSETATATIAA